VRVTRISTACNTQHAFNFRLVCTVAGESTLSSSDSAIKTTDVKKEMNNYLCLEVQPVGGLLDMFKVCTHLVCPVSYNKIISLIKIYCNYRDKFMCPYRDIGFFIHTGLIKF